MSRRSSLHLDSRRHGLLLCAGGRLLSRDHDVPVLDASTVGDSEQGMEDKGLTSERAFGAQLAKLPSATICRMPSAGQLVGSQHAIRHRSNRTAVGPSSSVISEWLTTYSPSFSRLSARATRRDCSQDGPVRDAALIVPAGDGDGIKPRDRRR